MKREAMIGGALFVEATGSLITIKTVPAAKVRLLGASCPTDVSFADLYKDRDQIILSPEKGKIGVIALSVSVNGEFFGHGLFKIGWVGQNSDKSYLNLREEFVSDKGQMSDNGFEILGTFIDVRCEYRVPFVFWNESFMEERNKRETLGILANHFKIYNDGNLFCRFIVGDATVEDLETAVNQYRFDTDPEFRKEIASGLVNDRKLFASHTKMLFNNMMELEKLRKEIEARDKKINELKCLLKEIKGIIFVFGFSWWKMRKIQELVGFYNKTIDKV